MQGQIVERLENTVSRLQQPQGRGHILFHQQAVIGDAQQVLDFGQFPLPF